MRRSIQLLALAAGVAAALTPIAARADMHENNAPWPHWRGPSQNGTSAETGLPERWEINGENHLWKADIPLRSTPIVMNGRVYVLGRAGKDISEQERAACFDAKTGELLWDDAFNIYLTTIPFPRAGWASPVGDPETGNIYVHGVGGVFRAYDQDGNILWSKSLTERFGRISGYGGRTNTPVIAGNNVVVSFLNSSWGGQIPRHRFWAFAKNTGDLVWTTTLPGRPLDTTYSVPVVADIGERRLIVTGAADGAVYALQATTGEIVWSFALTKRGVNASVAVDGNRVYAAHGEENIDSNIMGSVICIDGSLQGDITRTGALWRQDGYVVGYTSPAVHNGVLYNIDNSSNLHAFNGETGNALWTHGVATVGKGSPVIADRKAYVPEVNGRLQILRLGAAEPVLLDEELFMLDDRPAEIYGSPAVGYRRVYIPTESGLYCIGTDPNAPTEASLPPMLGPEPEEPVMTAARLQIRPSEALLKPGESADFAAYAVAENGYLIAAKAAEWSVAGAKGSVDARGRFTARADSNGSAGVVTAKIGDLQASGRVRIVPNLPYEEDFSEAPAGQAPPFWIGSAGKFKTTELEGERVLHKGRVARGLDRSYVYIGAPDSFGYEVQADMMGTKPRRAMPDMGVIANRYVLTLEGNHQQLHIFSWASDLRMAKHIPFQWEPDVWYRMKMRVDAEGEVGVVRGKVWKRGEPEPKNWTIEAEDPYPNREGSPGIYGFSYADIYYDNISIRKAQ